jgi:phosphoglycolate phosphatase-like HAD superfamily hydrolase
MERAFAELGAPPSASDFEFGGMTDRAIARLGLRNAGLVDEGAAIDAVLERYLSFLREEVPRARGYRVLPGVDELVERLRRTRGLAVGLGTGNLAAGAQIKLTPAGLHKRFEFGGFGSDHEDRAVLLEVGARRGAERLGVPRTSCRVVVIGDTPRDIAAAHAIGAECLAVATGRYDVEVLRACGAEMALEDLSDARAFEFLVD